MRNKTFAFGTIFAIGAIATAIYFLLFLTTNYVVYQPGSAENVRPMIQMEGSETDESGMFMLTTVSQITKVNVMTYAYHSLFNPHAEIFNKQQVFREGEDREQYFERQNYNMISSQNRAILAAYNEAGVEYDILTERVIVIGVAQHLPAMKKLRVGDQILKIDDVDVKDAEMLSDTIAAKEIGDVVHIHYHRDGEEAETTIELGNIANEGDEARAGIGITMGSVLTVQSKRSDQQVAFSVSEIGGPSAGFMFAMEIYNRLVPTDITYGMRIAGTGEISPEGQVGTIGGVAHKVVAAEREQAVIFFCPSANYKQALETAEKIKSNMHIVSVDSMKEAIDYLNQYETEQAVLFAS